MAACAVLRALCVPRWRSIYAAGPSVYNTHNTRSIRPLSFTMDAIPFEWLPPESKTKLKKQTLISYPTHTYKINILYLLLTFMYILYVHICTILPIGRPNVYKILRVHIIYWMRYFIIPQMKRKWWYDIYV